MYSSSEGSSRESKRKKKIKKLKKRLNLKKRDIKIVLDSTINAYVNNDNKIYVNTGALDNLDLDELAFLLLHEESHIESGHVEKNERVRKEVASEVASELSGVWSSESGFLKKIFSSLIVGAAGVATCSVVSQAFELEADINAQKKLQEAGFGEEGGQKLFKRFNKGFSLSHPSVELRKNIIKK